VVVVVVVREGRRTGAERRGEESGGGLASDFARDCVATISRIGDIWVAFVGWADARPSRTGQHSAAQRVRSSCVPKSRAAEQSRAKLVAFHGVYG